MQVAVTAHCKVQFCVRFASGKDQSQAPNEKSLFGAQSSLYASTVRRTVVPRSGGVSQLDFQDPAKLKTSFEKG